MLPTFSPSTKLGVFLTREAEHLSQGGAFMRRYGLVIDGSPQDYAVSHKVLELFDAAVFAFPQEDS